MRRAGPDVMQSRMNADGLGEIAVIPGVQAEQPAIATGLSEMDTELAVR